jgi:hypothetical protein
MPLEKFSRGDSCAPVENSHERIVKKGSRPAIIITGAAHGIGKEIARLAALDGSFLLLVDGIYEQLRDLVSELAPQGAGAAGVCVDPASSEALRSIEDALAAHDLYCDVLVNAESSALFGPAINHPVGDQTSIIDVNIRALIELTLRFVPDMVRRGRGGVLNVGSIAGYAPAPNMAVYAASKAFVNSFTAALATELAGTGVAVAYVAPGLGVRRFLQQCPSAPAWLLNLMRPSSAFDAAVAAWLGFKTGERVIVPTLTSRFAVLLSRLVQDSILLRFLGALQRPAETG